MKPSPADEQWVKELYFQTPIITRFAPVFKELIWFFSSSRNPDQHVKPLPDYCYNILDVFHRTTFKYFPLLSDVMLVMNPAALPAVKSIEEAKKVVRLDWRNLGRASAIGMRCIRFAQMEAEAVAKSDGFGDESPDTAKELFTVIFGRGWVGQNEARILATPVDKLFAELLNEFIAEWVKDLLRVKPQLDALAYQWSPEAMIEFNEGYAEGMTAFLDKESQFREESERMGTYIVLLLVWPEIQRMQESRPRKTLTDLHEWLEPFIRIGMMPNLDIDQFRDVCATPPSGIGLVMRPLTPRLPSA